MRKASGVSPMKAAMIAARAVSAESSFISHSTSISFRDPFFLE